MTPLVSIEHIIGKHTRRQRTRTPRHTNSNPLREKTSFERLRREETRARRTILWDGIHLGTPLFRALRRPRM